MPFQQTYAITWSEFVIHYKLIKSITQFSIHSIYGQYSIYLHLPTKQKIIVKQVNFDNQDQFNYILNEIQQSTQFNKCQSLCKFLKFCIRLNPHINKNINQSPYLEKSGSILLIYESQKTLQQIVKQMLLSTNNANNSFAQTKFGLSPSKYKKFASQLEFSQYFSQQILNKILLTTIKFIQFLKEEQIDSIKAISWQMIQIYNYGEVNQRCKYFLYPFVQNDLFQMVKQNKIDIEEAFFSQFMLQILNKQQQKSSTNRIFQERNKNIKNGRKQHINQFTLISLENQSLSPSFNFSKNKTQFLFYSNQQSIYIQLLQSIGLLIAKLMALSVSKQKFSQTKFYAMNPQYKIVLNYNQIRQCLLQIKSLNKYSRSFIANIQKLIFNVKQIKTLQQVNEIIYGKFNSQNSLSQSNQKNSVDKIINQQNKKVSVTKITPSKRIGISGNKLNNSSKIQLNETLKQKKIFINQRSRSKQTSKSKSKSSSFHQQKSENIQKPDPTQFSPSSITNHISSNKKPLSIEKPPSVLKQFPENKLSEQVITKLKTQILYDKKCQLYPNMTQKKFRDGSTYYGQYNPKLNIKQGNGLYFYFQGDVYGGTWKNDQLNGLGIYYFANGDSYEGQVINGEKYGFGVYHYSNGNIYKGFWKHDKKQGQGQMKYRNGDFYHGDFIDGRKQGKGTYNYINGDCYEGNFVKNIKHGKGIFKPAHSENIIQGLWQNDKFINKQKAKINYKHSNKIYEGQIRQNGIIQGTGILLFDQKGLYQGEIKNNNFDGRCQINYPNGDSYKGQIKNNLFDGHGQYKFAQKKIKYNGFWHQGLQHGQGKIIFQEEGTIIFSKWEKGKFFIHKGKISYLNNQKYQGDINENGRHGRGKYFFNNGNWIEAQFQNNKIVHIYESS